MKRRLMLNALKLYYYTKRMGFKALFRRGFKAVFPRKQSYAQWLEKHAVTHRMWMKQRQQSEQWSFCVDVICLGDVKERRSLEESLLRQSANNGKLCDDYRTGKGEFILLAGSDVYLCPDALYELCSYMTLHKEIAWCYSDHDMDKKNPVFKPDFNRDYFLSYPYIGDLIFVRRSFLDSMDIFRVPFVFMNMYDILLTLLHRKVSAGHIPKILYHTSIDVSVKRDYDVEKKMLQNYLKHEDAKCCVDKGIVEGTWDIRYEIKGQPLISVIIPNKDHMEDLKKCIRSVQAQDYKNIEILIAENNSETEEIFDYYESLQEKYDNIKVISWTRPFNYSAINNDAARLAKGEYLLFLNNDVELRENDGIKRLLQLCGRKNTGVVGAKLLYPDGTIQHAGVVIGYGGVAGHAFLGCGEHNHGYMNRIDCVQNYSAVTAACMMVKKTVFDACEGFDEGYTIALNDVDLCLRIRQLGYVIVYTPYVTGWHYESKSRGKEDTCSKLKRYNQEIERFRERWKAVFRQGDEAYNPNLPLDRWDFWPNFDKDLYKSETILKNP